VRTTQLFVASTLYGVMNLAAAIDTGQFDRSATPSDPDGELRRILVISDNSALPEISTPPDRMTGFELLAKRFDRVLSYNEAIAPLHPSGWHPRHLEVPLWERYLRRLWDLGDDAVHLIVESIQVDPARSICSIFADARIDVYADGLMSFGPTRSALEPQLGSRLERLVYADLVPGLTPLLLSEWPIQLQVVPTPAIKQVIDDIAQTLDLSGVVAGVTDGPDDRPVAIVLGQYLSALQILSPAEEEDLHLRMLAGAIARGHRHVIFKAHPAAPRELAQSLRAEAARCKVDFEVITVPVLAEVLYARLTVAEVIGCFSTGLFTAKEHYQIPVARIGTELMLERLTPYHNSNRIPVTIADALLPDLDVAAGAVPSKITEHSAVINDLVAAVGFVMQPRLLANRRPAAERFLADNYRTYGRYFKRHRLAALGLHQVMPQAVRRRAQVRQAAGRVRRILRRAPVTVSERVTVPRRRRTTRPAQQ